MKENKFTVEVPVLCTKGMQVFPNNEIIINVARPFSLNAITQARQQYANHIFVVSQIKLDVENPLEQDLFTVGTLCQITGVRKNSMFLKLTVKGIDRAKIKQVISKEDYLAANVEILNDVIGSLEEENYLVTKIYQLTNTYRNILRLPERLTDRIEQGITALDLTNLYGTYFPMNYQVSQQLLELLNVNERLLLIDEVFQSNLNRIEIEKNIERKLKERNEESQKEYYLREKLKIIKEELGDVTNGVEDSEYIRDTVLNNPYPENIREKVLEELSRIEMLPPGSSETGIIRTYIDWLLKTPWYQESVDNEDLNEASRILDDEHFGLEKVKERILEYLAVKQMTKSLKSPIICLVGPPGVGKTSLARSIANSLNRKFVKISLGGVKDESEIRGHRRTYIGALPGRFIQAMKKAEVINPVFLIDEIDKMASDYKGDPSSAMLEVLDPEQNEYFSDHYLGEPYDLSKVMFIATANYIENIPPALQDRLEVIDLSSYTELEKLQIAKKYLVTKQIKNTGLKKSQFKIGEEELLYIIRRYTREAGVRQIERIIGTLARKTALAIITGKSKSVKISKAKIVEWLGKEKFEYGSKEKNDQVGVVTGLAYTSFGGDVLSVEVNYFEGKGKFVVTGQLGDVMKESTEIALDYIKANVKKFDIDPKFFDTNDIHIHVPEGAVPKDGPSAGITLTTAIVSALTNRKVKSTIAMTGEVTLRGNVLPIGGLKEKSLAAHRSGIKTIIFPKANVKDLDEVPEIVKNDIEYIPVEDVAQVIELALV